MDLSPPPSPRERRRRLAHAQPYSQRPVSFREKDPEIFAIQCWTYRQAQSQYACDKINEDEIASWLDSGTPLDRPLRPLSAGLKLICRHQENSMTPPFEEDILQAIHKSLGLPGSHAYLTTPGAGVCGHYLGNLNNPVFIYHRSSNNGTVSAVLRYNTVSNITTGYILLGPRISHEMQSVLSAITSEFPNFSHPFLIPILMTEFTAKDLLKELTTIHLSLARIERDTGYGDWKASEVMVSRTRCEEWARELGRLSCRFAFHDVAIQCTLMVNDFTLKEMELMKDYLAIEKFQELEGFDKGLRNRTVVLESNLKHLKMFGGISQRMQAQQNVIFNLVTQQDNALNFEISSASKEIAAESKRDSSAMKIIAFLTTIFLPGTFISTFFAMPLFNWGASQMNGVMTDHFWVYWAVTIPLTVVVMAVVLGFAVYQKRKNEVEREREKERNKQGKWGP